jgi:hypothetical protein
MYEISTSSVQYYRRSLKAPIIGLLFMGFTGLIGIPILAIIYAFLIHVIPFLIVRIVLVLGYPLVCGSILALAAKKGKIRNLTVIKWTGFFFGLFAEYIGWVIWIAIISKEISLLWKFFFPMDVAYLISIIAELGVWSFRNIEPTGWGLYFFWLIEALIVVGGTTITTHVVNMDTPFCEECNTWAEKVSNIGVFAPIGDPLKFKKEFEQVGYSTLNQFMPAKTGNMFTIVQLYECDECKNFFVLNIKNQTIKLDSKGKRREESTPIISNLLVTSSVVAMIRNLMVKHTL